jgi:hypothetical protein
MTAKIKQLQRPPKRSKLQIIITLVKMNNLLYPRNKTTLCKIISNARRIIRNKKQKGQLTM